MIKWERGDIKCNGEKLRNILVCIASVQQTFYTSLQGFMTSGRSVKEFFILLIFHKLLVITNHSPLLYPLPNLLSLFSIANQLIIHIKRSSDDIHKEDRGDMILVVVPTLVQNHTFKQWMISMANVYLLWFGMSPSLPPRCEKASLRVLDEKLTSLINMDYS